MGPGCLCCSQQGRARRNGSTGNVVAIRGLPQSGVPPSHGHPWRNPSPRLMASQKRKGKVFLLSGCTSSCLNWDPLARSRNSWISPQNVQVSLQEPTACCGKRHPRLPWGKRRQVQPQSGAGLTGLHDADTSRDAGSTAGRLSAAEMLTHRSSAQPVPGVRRTSTVP